MSKRIANMQRVILATDDQGRAVYITREWLKALLADIGDATVTNVTNVTNQTTENITQQVGGGTDGGIADLAPLSEAATIAQASALIDALNLAPAQATFTVADDLSSPALPASQADDLTPPSMPVIVQDLGTEGLVSFLLAKVAELEKDVNALQQGYQL